MTIYGYPEDKFEPKFLEAIKAAEYQFLRDTQNYSLKNDLSSNELLNPEYKRAFIKLPEANYDGGVIFSFKEEAKKQGKDNVLFTPLLTADENRAAFDSLREDYKEKLAREFEKRDIKYDNNLLNALSSRDSHRISMAIAQNGLKEKDISVALNVAQKPIINTAAPSIDDNYNVEQVKKLKDFYEVQKEGATPEVLVDHAKGNKPAEKALEQVANEEIDKANDKATKVVEEVKNQGRVNRQVDTSGIDFEAHKRELVQYMDYMDKNSNYYSMRAEGGRPRNDCSTLVGDSLALEFGKGDYPKESWGALHAIIGAKGARTNSQDMIENLIRVAGDGIVGKDMHLKSSDTERKEILLNMIKDIGHGGIIATDKGKTHGGFDVGRKWGIDHIVRVIEKDGQLYVCETTSPNGTQMTPAEKWAEQKSHIRGSGINKGLGMVENFYAVRGKDLRDAMASGDFVKDFKNRNYILEGAKSGMIEELKLFASENNIDPRVAAAYIKYNDNYEKFAEAVKNIDDNPAATWKKLQDHAKEQAKGMGIDYQFDKNDGLIAKIFAMLGMMLEEGAKEQTMKNNAPEVKTTPYHESVDVERGGVTENKPDITTTTTTTVKGLDMDKLAAHSGEQKANTANTDISNYTNSPTEMNI